MPLFLLLTINVVTLAFDSFGVMLVMWGGIVGIYQFGRTYILHRGQARMHELELLRLHFGQKMVLGLEFFIAGDIIRLISEPTFESLTRIGVIVTIRTILAYFLRRDIKELKQSR